MSSAEPTPGASDSQSLEMTPTSTIDELPLITAPPECLEGMRRYTKGEVRANYPPPANTRVSTYIDIPYFAFGSCYGQDFDRWPATQCPKDYTSAYLERPIRELTRTDWMETLYCCPTAYDMAYKEAYTLMPDGPKTSLDYEVTYASFTQWCILTSKPDEPMVLTIDSHETPSAETVTLQPSEVFMVADPWSITYEVSSGTSCAPNCSSPWKSGDPFPAALPPQESMPPPPNDHPFSKMSAGSWFLIIGLPLLFVVADQLEELVLYNDAWANPWEHLGTEASSGNAKVIYVEKTHNALVKHISTLGISSKSTESMLGLLNSVKSCLSSSDSTDNMTGDPKALAKTMVIALLSLCKHIKYLQIGTFYPFFDEPDAFEEYMVRSNYGDIPNPGLQNLEIVHCDPGGFSDCRYYDSIYPLESLDCFFKLPALQTVRMTGVDESDNNEMFLFLPGTGTFSNLHFTHVGLTTEGICAMIRSAKRLEEFKIKTGGLEAIDSGFASMALCLLGRCLAEHKSTLRVLDFNVTEDICSYGNDEDKHKYPEDEEDEHEEEMKKYDLEANEYTHPIVGKQKFQAPLFCKELPDTRSLQTEGIGSLDEFEVLTHLSIIPKVLLGIRPHSETTEDGKHRLVDMLPPGLESLCFYEYEKGKDEHLDGQVKEVVDAVGSRFPGLNDVRGVDELVAAGDIRAQDAVDKGSDDDEDDEEGDEEGRLWKRPDPSDDIGWVKA
ncbi:hypothetical protein F5X68DRAFT_264020 [Plectosphaerella plurivora]|uniref:Uncharacterized protein n=1 Tax=Plectosphaerella plurivora TaxID=936078 RepID=A0A9P8V5T4_9PEZI|nr:hypothetical protein F5X68DRAFT_264020 [Plectosphaerella plurivora]